MVQYEADRSATGSVSRSYSGVVTINGLKSAFLHEVLVTEEGDPYALVISFGRDRIEAALFDEYADTTRPLYRSHRAYSIVATDTYNGRVLDGLGRPRDSLGPVFGDNETSVFLHAPPMIHRKPITRPLESGVKVVDTTLPLGRGQREVIVGDRKLGKSTIATDILLNQLHADPPVHCVYVLCGQRHDDLAELYGLLMEHNAILHTTIVAATADDSLLAQYLAPFVGCTIAEQFRNSARDALVIYDDLSKHAKAYRSISLLLEHVPGREAYPGDIFSLHAGLLERAAQLSDDQSGGSLTALPIIETEEGEVSAFIPTNIISITDGQIYLDRGLFQKGFLPAVNIGLSVSRVGSQVQPPYLQSVLGGIRLALSQHKELQKLSQLETAMSKQMMAKIHRGDMLLELLKQEKHTKISYPEQAVLFYAVEHGLLDDLDQSQWNHFKLYLLELMKTRHAPMLEQISDGSFDEDTKEEIVGLVTTFKDSFLNRS